MKSKFPSQSGIIYCMTKKECDTTAIFMSKEGIKAASYHAGLADKKRNDVQIQWTSNKINVMYISHSYNFFNYTFVKNYLLHKFVLLQNVLGGLCHNCFWDGYR